MAEGDQSAGTAKAVVSQEASEPGRQSRIRTVRVAYRGPNDALAYQGFTLPRHEAVDIPKDVYDALMAYGHGREVEEVV